MPHKIKILPKSIPQLNFLKFCAKSLNKILNHKILVFKIILINPAAEQNLWACRPVHHFRLFCQKPKSADHNLCKLTIKFHH